MNNNDKVEAKIHVRRGNDVVLLTEAEFIEVYGTMIKPDERVTLMIDNYNIPLSANVALDIIKDGAKARALDKFPSGWEVDLEELCALRQCARR